MENIDGLDSNSTHNIVKGKRTKRMRLLSSTTTTVAANTNVVTMTSSCSSANSGGSSTTTYESEEEDMANCLILLAQGGESHHSHHDKQGDCEGNKTEKEGNSNTNTTTVANTTKVGFYIYECKTCNRTFPSFQALGGHRASHKKTKLVAEEKKSTPPLSSPPPPSQLSHMIVTNYDRFEEANVKIGPPISLNNINKAKIHECSICGSEFTSGQALGGHMRRHRASTNNTNTVVDTSCNLVSTQPRNILQLDLNLPAPIEDDVREVKFQFATNQILVGTPALVDCHY